MIRNKNLLILCVLGILAPQMALAADRDIARISKDVSSRIDIGISRTGNPGIVQELLSKPLTADSAVQIALTNNQSLRAVLESWGIASAAFKKKRLPENPTFGASVRFPHEDEPYNNVEFTIEQDFLSLVLFPLKSSFAGAELNKAELQITKEVLDLAFEVKSAFYEVQGIQAMFAMRKRVLEQAEASAELAKRQFEAGNINQLGLANERSIYQDAKLEYLRSEADLAIKKETLNRLMGFGGKNPSWKITDNLQEIQASETSYDELLSIGMSKKLELLIARKNLEALKQAVSLSRFGVLGHPEVGVSTEKEVNGERLTGPTLRTEVPIYDLGQTDVSRSGAELKEAEFRLGAMENDARSEIKQKRDHLLATRALVDEYRDSVIPIREKATEETQKHYNYMLLGNYDLIRAKQNEILAYKEYMDLLKDYWITRSDLEKSIGSKLPLGKSIDRSKKEKTAEETQHAHHGENHE